MMNIQQAILSSRPSDSLIRKSPAYRSLEAKWSLAEVRLSALRAENAELAERVGEITKRICNVQVQYPPGPYRRFRVCIEIDREIIESGFLHGNDATVIEHMGQHLGRMAAYEIRRANFQRWET